MSNKKNWFIEANKSTDPVVKDLLNQYNSIDANAENAEAAREDLKQQIKVSLELADETPKTDAEPEKPVADTAETPAEPETAKDESTSGEQGDAESDADSENADSESGQDDKPSAEPEKPVADYPEFTYTEQDAKTAKDVETCDAIRKACRIEVKRLENTRLKHATYKQNLALDHKIWDVRRIIGLSLKRESALKEREHRAKKLSRVSNIAMKRARFVKLLRAGYSITNITKHSEGVSIDEIVSVMDADTIESCHKIYSRFPEMWDAWKAKYIDKQDEKK